MKSKYTLIILAILVSFFTAISLLPSDFKIQRSITINAKPDKVFPYLNNFHQWENWSPWAKLDPKMISTFEGPEYGEGSSQAWSSQDNKVGEGKMTITKSMPDSLLEVALEFKKPMQAKNKVVFSLEKKDGQTEVIWTMTGKNNFMGKVFFLLFNMDQKVGGDFEKGLAQLKTVAEASH